MADTASIRIRFLSGKKNKKVDADEDRDDEVQMNKKKEKRCGREARK
jgi:hypothetical protein